MNDEPVANEEHLNAARSKLVADLAEYADGWNTTEGGVVVSFIALFEVMSPDGNVSLVEVCGAGPDGTQGVEAWKRDGILHHTLFSPQRRYH